MDNLPQNNQNQKTFLSSLTAKIILALAVFAGSAIIIISGIKFIVEYYKTQNNQMDSQIIKPINQQSQNYYDLLEKKCAGSSCCLASLKAMRKNNYKEAGKDYKCPDGFKSSGLRCESSLSWCEPIEEDYSMDKKISKEQAISLLKKQCGYYYDYDNIIKVGNEWRVIIINVNCPCCYGIVNAESGTVDCFKKIPCLNCAKEGNLINYPSGTNKNLPNFCCKGLKALAGFGINENYECERIIGGPFLTCMPCGNGVCEEINNFKENKCNCPEDCGDEKKYNGFTIKGNDIYSRNIKIGFIEEDKINIFINNDAFTSKRPKIILTFIGNLNKLEFFANFCYDDLSISDGLYRANSLNSPLNITYNCDGPLRNLKNVRYEHCKTNRKDYLTQYEFSDLTSSGFGTGGGTAWRWYKLYIKKINGVDFVFQGGLYDNLWSNVDNWIEGPSIEDKEKYKRLSTKKHLDEILTDKSIVDKINKWDKFVDSL